MFVWGLVPCSASAGQALRRLPPPPTPQLPLLTGSQMSHGCHEYFKEVFSVLLDGSQL